MNRYVAFLRGVNVGGSTVIKMADLKQLFESLGLKNVQTYIQSGNVIFETSEGDATSPEKQIEARLETAFGYRIRLFVRTWREAQAIARKTPFTAGADETVHVVFLNRKPDKARNRP
jgi:uncharacterized protein (DUF1697 family)